MKGRSRVEERKGFEVPVRVQLLEGDVDGAEDALESFRLELRGIRNVMVGMLISVSTGAVLLAVNLVANGS